MLKNLHGNKRLQLKLGLALGILFGFLLQKGGVTN
jgi:acid phosphatase family membrane protein YuiD